MIRTEYIDDGARVRHWSDNGMMIRQVETNHLYEDAVDVVPCRFIYTESDIPISDSTEALADKSQAYDILMGGDE